MHMMRATDPHFLSFGEIYFSWINPGIVKGWHKHSLTTVNLAVPVGKIKIAVFDDRPDSATRGKITTFILGANESDYALLTIAPGLWYAFSGQTNTPSMIANCASHPHAPGESEQRELNTIEYDWSNSHD